MSDDDQPFGGPVISPAFRRACRMSKISTVVYSRRIAEYWVVDCAAKAIHVFSDPKDGRYGTKRIVSVPNTLTPDCNRDAVLDLSELFL
ncbi:hypothetical protein [Stieleria sp.]|uniref:hypothetical protein n=1 Tax=Stieleria sp. TaxID=2795976 RepID=UPI00356B1A56